MKMIFILFLKLFFVIRGMRTVLNVKTVNFVQPHIAR